MAQSYQIRFPRWLWLTLAVAIASGAAFSYMVYLANGVVVGALWGLPGREHQIALAQHQGRIGLVLCVLLQFGVAGALFGFMDRETYRAARIVWALVLSLVLTTACGIAILLGMRAVR